MRVDAEIVETLRKLRELCSDPEEVGTVVAELFSTLNDAGIFEFVDAFAAFVERGPADGAS